MSPVTGQVVNYDPSLSLVQVNRGSEAGVERGYTLDITSNGRYLGRMRVDRVSPNICAGVMTVKNQRPGESFNVPVGAQATNRLN